MNKEGNAHANRPGVIAAQMLRGKTLQEQEGRSGDLVQDLHPTTSFPVEAAKAGVKEGSTGRLQSYF
jgi:hypothetical protein